MKKTRTILLAMTLAAAAALSSCTAGETAKPQTTSAPAETVMVTFGSENMPAEGETVGAAVSGGGDDAEATGTMGTLPVTIDEDAPEETVVGTVSGEDSESTQIHLSAETVEIDLGGIDTDLYELGDSLGEYKDDSYWDRMLDNSSNPQVNDNIIIVSVDYGTDDEMMREVLDRFGLEVVYDYTNFSMYALSFTGDRDRNEKDEIIAEMLNDYSFIISVEYDSIMQLDGASDNMLY